MFHRILFDLSVAGVFIVMMSVLVTAHELGHYLFARFYGMGVEEFAVGWFGKKPLFTYARRTYRIPLSEAQATSFRDGGYSPKREANETGSGNAVSLAQSMEAADANFESVLVSGPALQETTRFTVRPMPLGGFVRIKGMLPEEDGSETQIPGGFYSKSPYQRFVVLLAGPMFSVLAGVAILIPYFMSVGVMKPRHDPVIGRLAVGRAGDKGGLKVGDRVLSVNGKPVTDFFQIISEVRDRAGRAVPFVVQRGAQQFRLIITPEEDSVPTPVLGADLEITSARKIQGKLGAAWLTRQEKLGFSSAIVEALTVPYDSVIGLVGGILHPARLKDEVGGPATMISLTADATDSGISQVIFLAAVLSISVGIFNLLPFPPLDGGQMVMAIAEMLRGGRRLSLKAQSMVIATGLTIVAVLVVSVVFIDFQRFRNAASPSKSTTSAGRP